MPKSVMSFKRLLGEIRDGTRTKEKALTLIDLGVVSLPSNFNANQIDLLMDFEELAAKYAGQLGAGIVPRIQFVDVNRAREAARLRHNPPAPDTTTNGRPKSA